MAGTVTIEVHGNEVVAALLAQTGDRAVRLEAVWPQITRYMRDMARQNIESEGASTGPRWDDLSYEWLNYKFQHGLSLEMMKATEELFESLTGETEDSEVITTEDTMVFGSTLPQFDFQMTERDDVPFRPPVRVTDEHRLTITSFVEGHLMGTFNRRGQRVDPKSRRFVTGPNLFRGGAR